MKQIARNLTDAIDESLRDTRFLIHDRDPLFSASFCATLSAAFVEKRPESRQPFPRREEPLREAAWPFTLTARVVER